MRSFAYAAGIVLLCSTTFAGELPLRNNELTELVASGCPDAHNLRIEEQVIKFTYNHAKKLATIESCVKDRIAFYRQNGFPVNLGDITAATTITMTDDKIILK